MNLHTKLWISQVYCTLLRDYFYIITVLFSLSMTNVALMTFCCIGLGLQVKVSKQVKGTFNTFQFAIGGFVIVIICYYNQSLAKNIYSTNYKLINGYLTTSRLDSGEARSQYRLRLI